MNITSQFPALHGATALPALAQKGGSKPSHPLGNKPSHPLKGKCK